MSYSLFPPYSIWWCRVIILCLLHDLPQRFLERGKWYTTFGMASCVGPNALGLSTPTNILIQVTMNIQSGTCGALGVGDSIWQFAELCADGTTCLCVGDGTSLSFTTNLIHQGFQKNNILALEVVATGNNQIAFISFINGQYVSKETFNVNQIKDGSELWIETEDDSATLTSILYTNVKVWRVVNPLS